MKEAAVISAVSPVPFGIMLVNREPPHLLTEKVRHGIGKHKVAGDVRLEGDGAAR
jgi:hypothetical protein